jgi:nucleotide-binding universal stress UspA family protein
LHVVPSAADVDSEAVREVQAEFARRGDAAGIPGRLVVVAGEASRAICQRARLVDLVVLSLSFPPGAGPLARLSSGFRTVLLRCPRPVLAVPSASACTSLEEGRRQRAVLAYDDSRKAQEALYIATYLAIRWDLALAVVTVAADEDVAAALQAPARRYLEERGVPAEYVIQGGYEAAAAHGSPILDAARARDADLLLLGGYGRSPLVEAALGSTVDAVLRGARRPVLISR